MLILNRKNCKGRTCRFGLTLTLKMFTASFAADMKKNDEYFMRHALDEARLALTAGEFPVGCVLAAGDAVLAKGRRKNSKGDMPFELDHAEIVALRNLEGKTPRHDRSQITAYSTMEPCLMCLATLIINNITRIVYAYEDVMGGGANLKFDNLSPLYHERQPNLKGGILRSESLILFQQFFRHPDNIYWKDSPLASYTLNQK